MSVLKLYNPEAYRNNTLVVHKSQSGCCQAEMETCKYVADFTNVKAITAITVMDGETPREFEISVSTERELRIEIAAILKSLGYDPYYADSWKGVEVSNGQISIIGEAVPVSITVKGVVNFKKLCTTGRVCKMRGMVEYESEVGLISYNGSAGTQIADSPTANKPEEFKASIVSALVDENAAHTKVEVVEHPEHGSYVYTIHFIDNPTVLVDGNSLTECGCYPDFVK